MMSLYVNNVYVADADTPRSIILMGISVKVARPDASVTVRNDFGDEWDLTVYIDLIETHTALRIKEKDLLP